MSTLDPIPYTDAKLRRILSTVRTIAMVGAKRGALADIAEQVILVDDTHYGRVEDVHMHIFHMICYAFMEKPTE